MRDKTSEITSGVASELAPVHAPATLLPAVLDAVGLSDRYFEIDSPIGRVFIAHNRHGVSSVSAARSESEFVREHASRTGRDLRPETDPPAELVRKIDEALAGKRTKLVYDLRGISEFGRAVLAKAQEIPVGQVRPYGWIASEIGRPKAVRAVGTALGHNPVPLLIPCHRVVRTDGRIGDYALGSPAKRQMLSSEGVDPAGLERLAARGIRVIGSDTTKVFCHPTCSAAGRIADRHRVPFRSSRAAVDAGYRPCKQCRPVVEVSAA